MQRGLTFENVHNFLSGFLAEDVHAKRVYSLANATLGVMSSASLAVNTIGQGLALARGGNTKHAIKQVDRLLSNQGVEVAELQSLWVRHVIGARQKVVVAMDWTEFEPDGRCCGRRFSGTVSLCPEGRNAKSGCSCNWPKASRRKPKS